MIKWICRNMENDGFYFSSLLVIQYILFYLRPFSFFLSFSSFYSSLQKESEKRLNHDMYIYIKWVLSLLVARCLELGKICMEGWGYTKVDEIVWVRLLALFCERGICGKGKGIDTFLSAHTCLREKKIFGRERR